MKKVLVIEDDKIWLKTLTVSLEAENIKVISAIDGEEGLRLASQEKVDLILLDFILPSLSGLEVCQRLRTRGISTPIVMVSGEKKEEIDKIIGLELGADDYLVKPFGIKELVARMNAVLRRSRPQIPEPAKPSLRTHTLHMPLKELTRGMTFAGRFEVVEELGEGGMGKVYKVIDIKIEETVALKLLRPEIAADQEIIERFRNELKFARKISQRNVCRMYDLNEEHGTHYITMEFVPGEDLKSMIKMTGRLSVGKAVAIAKQVCEGLAEAHKLGVVHRDIKPQNIMVDKEGSARIMDFGIARSLKTEGLTEAGAMIGTPEYMSPEQVEGKEIDPRSDIYSLGVTLYEMVTGRLPFKGESPVDTALRHKIEKPSDPKIHNPQIPEDFSRMILKCLEKNKENRYQSAEDVLFELNKIEKSFPVTERVLLKKEPEAERMAEMKWKNSIAILPFADISLQKDQEYFCDGMTEDIITKLSRLEELKVISRTSVMRYKKAYKDIKEIGKELGVATILEGGIRREKDNIRVNAQLVNVEDGFHLWADVFDRKLESIFEVQDEVSQAIADALKVKLTPKRLEALKVGRPRDIDAYEYVLKGMHFINSKYVISHREEDFKTAVKMLKKAYELDPNYVLAYTGLCWAYQHHYQITGKRTDLVFVVRNAEKAYAIDPNLVETNGAIAWVYFLKGEQDKAYLSYKRALEINPNIPGISHLISLFFRSLGLLQQALEYSNKSIELDPFFLPAHSVRNRCLIYTGQLEKASASIKKSLEVEPDNFWSLQDYSLLSMVKGKIEEAEKFLTRVEKISTNYPGNKFYKALLFAKKGEKKKALTLQKNGVIYSLLGMKDKALDYIHKEIEKGKEHFQYSYLPLVHSNIFDSVRNEPRFKDIVKKQEKRYEERLKKYGKLCYVKIS